MGISRRGFVRDALGTAAALSGLAGTGLSRVEGNPEIEPDYYLQLVKANDDALQRVMESFRSAQDSLPVRRIGEAIDALAGAYCAPESSYFKSQAVLRILETAGDRLLAAQHADGTIDSGNLNSPPDTAFVVQTVCMALAVLKRMHEPELSSVDEKLTRFVVSAGEALVTGGIHTPNHRWVVCSALAQTNALFPAAKYVNRIDDWLSEGIYCDEDGQYAERSTGIYSRVIDNALITMARLLNRPELLEPVRRNLAMNIFYMHPDGELETVGSRRQDQTMVEWISNYYLQYRYMAILDNSRLFAAVAKLCEKIGLEHTEARIPLIEFLEEPLYRRKLPEPEMLPTDYARFFRNSNLARVRRGNMSATIYGGSDWPLGVASGLASNATFFNFRKGQAVLESVRLVPDFFSEGMFRSEGMAVEAYQYMLRRDVHVPYYQPLPKHLRNARGDYALTSAGGRYWSKMNFPERPKSNIQTLNQKITVTEKSGAFELTFEVDGHDRVPVTIELNFRGGDLEGVAAGSARPDLSFLRKGMGRFKAWDDVITFGPGQAEHERVVPTNDVPFGATQQSYGPDRHRVYITGFTPFRKTLTIA